VAKQTKRGAPRRGARAQVLGTTGTSPATKARIANATKPTNASPPPIEKIVVSNLPADVNEAQVKVRILFKNEHRDRALTSIFHIGALPNYCRSSA